MNATEYCARISIVGLGKLGLPMLAYFVSKGCSVIGVDKNSDQCAAVNVGKVMWHEWGVEEILSSHAGHFRATQDLNEAVSESDITFVVVPTPSESDGRFSNRFVLEAAEGIGRSLRQKTSRHLVVLTSTVMPGTTEGLFIPLLERSSGRTIGPDLGACYNPEFIALGSVIHDLTKPDLILIGEADEASGSGLHDVYRRIGCNSTCARMNPVSAELTKIAINSYMTLKITFANSLAVLCEETPHASVERVTEALGFDRRIGAKYLKAGLGYGGPCFPRDNAALARFAAEAHVDHLTFSSVIDSINQNYLRRIVKRIRALAEPDKDVSVLGLAYKPNTSVLIESQGLAIAKELSYGIGRLTVYDEFAQKSAEPVLGSQTHFAQSIHEAVTQADVVILALPGLRPRVFPALHPGQTVFDCWPGDAHDIVPAGVTYRAIGSGDY